MKDVQNERDERNISIHKVGIHGLSYPVCVREPGGTIQHTVASLNLFVDLPHQYRGTHMSRFIEVTERHAMDMKLSSLDEILKDMLETFDCETAHLDISFPYFIRKSAPVSGMQSMMEYRARVEGSLTRGKKLALIMEITVPVHNLCPCSKEISEYGAHNQRGEVKIRAVTNKLVWFEELIQIAEDASSAPLYALLKREDEKWVTEKSYENPKFVEDAARDVAVMLNQDPRIDGYSIEVSNFESIHNHNAYASIVHNLD